MLTFSYLYLSIDGIIWARKKNKEIFLMKSKRQRLDSKENLYEKRELLMKI